MKGGALVEKCREIGINDKYEFYNKIRHCELLRLFTFGTEQQMEAWMNLLRLASLNGVFVYILTSGNKIGIIRMLQLMLLDKYFEDV